MCFSRTYAIILIRIRLCWLVCRSASKGRSIVKQIVKSAASIGASVVVALAVAMPVSARVGVTAAVVPQTDALRPGNPLEPLVLGADIDFNEHIVTAQDGRAQILFLDHSTLNVGPNADVVIDKF